MANAGIYSQIQVPQPANALQDYGQLMQLQNGQQAGQLNALKLQGAQRDMADEDTVRGLAGQYGGDAAGLRNALMSNGLVTKAQALDKQNADIAKSSADADKAKMDAISKRVDIVGQAYGALRQNPTLETGTAVVQHLVDQGVYSPQQGQTFIAKMTANPEQIASNADIAFRAAVDAKDQLTQNSTVNTGNAQTFMSRDPVTGKSTIMGSTPIAQSPDNKATNDTSTANSIRQAGVSRQNNKDTIAKDYKVNGINPQTGNFIGAGPSADGTASPMAGMIDALGQGKMNPATAFARMAPGMKANVIAQVQAKYPDYDPTTYEAKAKAARDFTSGQQGNAMRSFQVAGEHLDTLGQLADALNNGNYPLVNKLGNMVSSQTGGAAPTNFDAAKDIVSKEVTKAIVGAGGGVSERQETAQILDTAKTPAQMKGAITQIRTLMAAQHDALLEQRRAAGLPDSTLPKYQTSTTPSANAPKVVNFGDLK